MVGEVNDEVSAIIRFGGGVHSRASESDIDPIECADGQNFVLDVQNRDWRPRPAFDLVGTVPNAGEIRGFISLLQSDGSVHFAVQADDKVYDWDGGSVFTEIATVAAGAKLRGRLEHNWQLDDKVLITDLTLTDVVMEWNGGLSSGDFADVSFTNESGSGFGIFKAKYCYVAKERAVFGNINDGSDFPHLIVGAKRQDYTVITVENRPSSALSAEDPWFLSQPDLRPINGMVEAFGEVITSSENGSLFNISGNDATDFRMDELFPRSGAQGDESLTFVGNDIYYGRAGSLESVRATEKFGNVETNDLSIDILDQIETFDDWTTVYNARLQRVYFFPADSSEIWVLNKNLLGRGVSPWSRWETRNSLAFQPTAVMNMLDPQDSLEYVFMGDGSGNLYRLEGTANSSDGGSDDILVRRTSKLIEMPLDANIYEIEGWVRYRKNQANTLTLEFLHAGENLFNRTINVNLDAVENAAFYSNEQYYTDGNYYGATFRDRLARKTFTTTGYSNEIQIRTTIDGTSDFGISEIGIKMVAVT